MHSLLVVTIICLLSFCYGQKYDTSDAVTLNLSTKSSRSCGGCEINIHDFEFSWYHQAYTHLAATIVKFVNNATNVTITSTIQGSSFTLPLSAAYAARMVPDSVITTTTGGVAYTLTYPTPYRGINGIERYSSTPITNANGTVKCVVSKAALTNAFFRREDISNGLELSDFIDQDVNRECELSEASPPRVLVRVSSLTATTTNYFDSPEARTSSAMKASPSNSLSPPTAPRTESSRLEPLDNLPTTTVLASPPPQKTAYFPSITPTSALTESIQSDLIESVPPATTLLVASKNPEAEPLTKPGILSSDQPRESSNGNPASRPGEPTPTVPMSPVFPTEQRPHVPGIAETVALSPDSSLPIGPSRSSPQVFGITKTIASSPDSSLPIEPNRSSPQVSGITKTVASSPDSSLPIGSSRPSPQVFGNTETGASSLSIDLDSIVNPSHSFLIGEPIFSRPNGRPVTTPTSLGLPDIVNIPSLPTSLPPLPSILTLTNQKSSSVANPSEFFLGGTAEIHRGGSTIITSGTRSISLGNSATVIVDESSTTPLAVYIVSPLSQVPGLHGTAKPTSALLPPAATTAAGNRSELFVGAQLKMVEVPVFVLLGAIFFGVAVPWGLRYV